MVQVARGESRKKSLRDFSASTSSQLQTNTALQSTAQPLNAQRFTNTSLPPPLKFCDRREQNFGTRYLFIAIIQNHVSFKKSGL
ncbi:MAG: hypothetical protein LBE57_05285 [Methanosarcinales archaeon]|jgi:hypothetical protein|nr:hypothetical protein [Methanosarcinales archaeon]